jgi:hypothetical protein
VRFVGVAGELEEEEPEELEELGELEELEEEPLPPPPHAKSSSNRPTAKLRENIAVTPICISPHWFNMNLTSGSSLGEPLCSG